jgi:hypothetical protein
MKQITLKVIIFWLTVGILAGALIGGYTVAVIGGHAFINYSLSHTTVCQPVIK